MFLKIIPRRIRSPKFWILVLVAGLLAGRVQPVTAGVAPNTERPRIDFDVVYKLLLPYGVWEKHEKFQWVFVPKTAPDWRPYRDGQWLYTSNAGWLWQGVEPWSWMTDHYGYWRHESGRWLWVPGVVWRPETVLWQAGKGLVGWRPVALNEFGEVRDSIEDLRKPGGWNVTQVTRLSAPLDRRSYVEGADLAGFLEAGDYCEHVFQDYRKIDRQGPDPVLVWPDPGAPPPIREIYELSAVDEPPPAQAPKRKIFLYRPVFAQDAAGILRRIKINLEPPVEKPDIRQIIETGGTNSLGPELQQPLSSPTKK